MEKRKILTISVLALCVLVWPVQVSEAEQMGTAFTYQGRLVDANEAADGLYDFQFRVYDANTDGNQLGTDVNKADVDVIDGYFAVDLDFGSVFDGDARWLEAGVRPGDLNDSNAYTTLSPRQQVTPTPYALQTRGLFVSDSGNLGIGTTNPDRNLDIRHSNTGGGIEIDRSDSTIWSGLVYENDGTEKWFAGMRPDSNNLVLKNKYAGNSIVCEDGTGNVGIGTSTPGFPLTFANSLGDKISLYGQSGDHYGFGIQSSLLQIHTNRSGSDIAFGFVSGGTFTERVRFEGNGEVGIGTANPDRNLDIRHSNSGGGIEIDREDSTIWSGVVYENDGDEKWFVGMQADSNNLLLKNDDAGPSIVIEDDTGNIGIATTDPAAKLHLLDPTMYGATGLLESTNVNGSVSLVLKNPGGKWSIAQRGDFMGDAYNALVIREDDAGTDAMVIQPDGKVGVGLTAPMERLDVYGTARLRKVGAGTGTTVVADANGKLWKAVSSRKYKTNIEDLEINPAAVLQLRPVSFRYKSSGQQDIGLIAEEVEKYIEDLVIYDNQERPDAVKYDKVALYLLEVIKSQREEIEAQQEQINELQKDLAQLRERLTGLVVE